MLLLLLLLRVDLCSWDMCSFCDGRPRYHAEVSRPCCNRVMHTFVAPLYYKEAL
jgi:hypothetical protein